MRAYPNQGDGNINEALNSAYSLLLVKPKEGRVTAAVAIINYRPQRSEFFERKSLSILALQKRCREVINTHKNGIFPTKQRLLHWYVRTNTSEITILRNVKFWFEELGRYNNAYQHTHNTPE